MLEASIRSWRSHMKGVPTVHIIVVGDKIPESYGVQNIVVPKEDGQDDRIKCIRALQDTDVFSFVLADSRTIICNDLNPGYLCIPMDNLFIPHVYNLEELAKNYGCNSFDSSVDRYREAMEPGMIMKTDWRSDNWMLPVVSKNPPASLIKQLIKEKLFIRFAPSSDSTQTELLIEGIFLPKQSAEDGEH